MIQRDSKRFFETVNKCILAEERNVMNKTIFTYGIYCNLQSFTEEAL